MWIHTNLIVIMICRSDREPHNKRKTISPWAKQNKIWVFVIFNVFMCQQQFSSKGQSKTFYIYFYVLFLRTSSVLNNISEIHSPLLHPAVSRNMNTNIDSAWFKAYIVCKECFCQEKVYTPHLSVFNTDHGVIFKVSAAIQTKEAISLVCWGV